ncbi:hypothetical protein [Pseudoalteromonas denitrificans]|uniref:hypothetical protein n=1 Tax=Pseudoalteromonas denitrificans TaxID=43656 RepID=UPI001C4324AF|nr:hypothetical protein [Pseudoalteromonas denitrificans]
MIKLKEQENSTTQALTEVALALSMAFFALLILALLSIGVPPKQKSESILNKKNSVKVTDSQIEKNKSNQTEDMQYVIYFQGSFYDQMLNKISSHKYKHEQPLLLAIERSLPISEVISLKSQIKHSNLSITTLNDQWLTRLEDL